MFFPSVGQQETKTQIFDGRVNFKRDPWWTAHRTFFLKNKRQKKFLIGQTANLLWMQQWLVAIPLFHSWSRENCIRAPYAIISLCFFSVNWNMAMVPKSLRCSDKLWLRWPRCLVTFRLHLLLLEEIKHITSGFWHFKPTPCCSIWDIKLKNRRY